MIFYQVPITLVLIRELFLTMKAFRSQIFRQFGCNYVVIVVFLPIVCQQTCLSGKENVARLTLPPVKNVIGFYLMCKNTPQGCNIGLKSAEFLASYVKALWLIFF